MRPRWIAHHRDFAARSFLPNTFSCTPVVSQHDWDDRCRLGDVLKQHVRELYGFIRGTYTLHILTRSATRVGLDDEASIIQAVNVSTRPPARYMTLTPHPHLPRLLDPCRPSLPLDADDFNFTARLLPLPEKRGSDVAGAPLPPLRGLQEARLHRTSFFRPPSRLSGAIRDDDHELASLLGFDIELQRCSVLVDPHCGNPKSLITTLLSINDPFKVPRWSVVPILPCCPASHFQHTGLFDARANFLCCWLLPLLESRVDVPA